MNRLLHYNVTNSVNTAAGSARISGWDIIGKTGTTDADKDSWFCGMSPYATLAIWTGFDYPHTISNTNVATNTFNKVMSSYLSGMEHKDFKFPSNLIEAQYSPYSGLIVSTENVSGKYVGYYTEDNMPSNGLSIGTSLTFTTDMSESSSFTSFKRPLMSVIRMSFLAPIFAAM